MEGMKIRLEILWKLSYFKYTSNLTFITNKFQSILFIISYKHFNILTDLKPFGGICISL